MKDGVKAVLVWVLIIAGAALGWWFYHSHETARKEAVQLKEKTDQLAKELMLGEFAKRHNAIVRWESLPKRGEYSLEPFAIDFSRALIRSNGQPVLLRARLREVMETDGGAAAYFSASDSDNDSLLGIPLASLDLKCSPEQVAELTKAGVSRDTKFALVAKVERVFRPKLRAAAQPGEEGGDPSIEIDTDSSVICVSGTLVDLLRLKGDEP